jgi:hypothetical protein
MDLDSVTSCFFDPQRRLTESIDNHADFFNIHFPATGAFFSTKGRGTHGLLPGQLFNCLASGMSDLDNDLPPRIMDSLRHFGKTGNEPVVVDCQMPWSGPPLRADAGETGNDKAHPTPGKFNHEIYELFRKTAVNLRHPFPGG